MPKASRLSLFTWGTCAVLQQVISRDGPPGWADADAEPASVGEVGESSQIRSASAQIQMSQFSKTFKILSNRTTDHYSVRQKFSEGYQVSCLMTHKLSPYSIPLIRERMQDNPTQLFIDITQSLFDVDTYPTTKILRSLCPAQVRALYTGPKPR